MLSTYFQVLEMLPAYKCHANQGFVAEKHRICKNDI